jgi:hypothetical protein
LHRSAALAAGVGLWIASVTASRGHDLFTAYIQHRVAVAVGARHVDVTIQLTFFEDGSEQERTRMDANKDGRISRAEIEPYLKDVETDCTKAVKLRIVDKAAELSALYAPQLDLLGNDRVQRSHHQLTLRFFAPTPPRLTSGTELVVEDRLWPGFRALGTMQAEGRDGCRLEAVQFSDPVFAPARVDEAREFKARILAPPVALSRQTNSPSPSRP